MQNDENVEKFEDIINSNIETSLMIGFHNRLNHLIQRSHPNIWSFKKCLPEEEARFRYMLLQMNASAQGRPLRYNNVLIH